MVLSTASSATTRQLGEAGCTQRVSDPLIEVNESRDRCDFSASKRMTGVQRCELATMREMTSQEHTPSNQDAF